MSIASQRLASSLLQSFATSMVDLLACPRPFVQNASERPRASLLARCQSRTSPQVTNLVHERVSLDDFQSQILRACDGTRNRNELVQTLCENTIRGDLVIFNGGQRLTNSADIQKSIVDLVPRILQSLAQQALFVA
jgi:methyltransferase-like protein